MASMKTESPRHTHAASWPGADRLAPTRIWSPRLRKLSPTLRAAMAPNEAAGDSLSEAFVQTTPLAKTLGSVRGLLKGTVLDGLGSATLHHTPTPFDRNGSSQRRCPCPPHEGPGEAWSGHISWSLRSQPQPLSPCYRTKRKRNKELHPRFFLSFLLRLF